MPVSLDGFSASAGQSLEAPFGHAGDRLMRWFMDTRSFHAMQGQDGGSAGTDGAFASNCGPGKGPVLATFAYRHLDGSPRPVFATCVEELSPYGVSISYAELDPLPAKTA